MKGQVIIDVAGVRRYSFKDNETGRMVEACVLSYYADVTSDDNLGSRCVEVSTAYENYDKFIGVKFPVRCKLGLDLSNLSKKPIIESIEVIRG